MRSINREVLARDAAWTLAEGRCKDLTAEWTRWEATYAASRTTAARQAALLEPAALCATCPIAAECAQLAELSGYTGIAAGFGYRNGRLDQGRLRQARDRRSV